MQSSSAKVTMESQNHKRAPAWTEQEVLDLIAVWGEESFQAELRSKRRNANIFAKISRGTIDRCYNRDTAVPPESYGAEASLPKNKGWKWSLRVKAPYMHFCDELHAILGGAPTATPPLSVDTCKGGVSHNRDEDFVDKEVEDSAQQASGESLLPGSRELFITLEPIRSQPCQGGLPNHEAGGGTSESDRRTVFIALTVFSLVGTFLFFLIRKSEESNILEEEVSSTDESTVDNSSVQSKATRAVDAFKRSIKLYFTKEILLLSVTTAYTGLELTFFSGVYGTCIGAVNRFGTEEKSLIGLSGIFIGIGEILGGGFFGLVNKDNRFGRNPVVMLGIVVHFLAFYLIFYNIPNDAPIASFKGTDNRAYMNPSKELAILCSFLLGLGDSCFNTQLLSILGFLYSEDSAPAFAVFKFVQSICAAIAFFYSNYLLLQWQLLIMAVVGFFGTISFFTVEWEAAAFVARGSDYRSI
ncbi:UNC93-like protein MFSD11 [Chelonia mydas]|uniref:UNC93-like protein MFSD11 n=1 Tax=Chelonia mydas TaxID=8469 RepID=M7AM48_CHEMY|nr:UNC93-like protein MFSD11 [Chelonia mydas]